MPKFIKKSRKSQKKVETTSVANSENPLMIKSIQKRTGEITLFDIKKIINAIWKAMRAANEGSEYEASLIANKVLADLIRISKKYSTFVPTVEGIQDSVEKELKLKIAESSKYFKTPYQEFIFYQFYSRWRNELGRRETWIEAIDRFMDYMKENMGTKLTSTEYAEIKVAILNQEVCPSMR